MYQLIVYNDLEKKEILYVGIFKTKKDINDFSDNLITYVDMHSSNKKNYRTYKRLFEINNIAKKLI